MYALVDCNSFFCSVEKVFHPGLEGKPVCVLSSNDGCIVALTPEAKRIGLRRGDPIFKVRNIVEQNNVHIFSTNMTLYAAMSRRVTSILRKSIHYVENYSIDESFCCLNGYEKRYNIEELMRGVAAKIRLWTDIPVSVGIAPSKTLAKVGSKYAKQYKGYRSVCLIDTDEKRRKALAAFSLGDVWGIGRSTLASLNYHGITTPLEFADKSEHWVRSRFNLPGIRTWMELNGIPCIDTAEVIHKQSICTSRSFGNMVTDLANLRESITHFASSSANKLRAQHSVAGQVTVFLNSNRFRDDLPQYSNAATFPFPIPTSDTIEISQAAIQLLKQMFRPGISYKKAGVILSDIHTATPMQLSLIDHIPNRPERNLLMKAIDYLNQRYGVKSIYLAAEGDSASPWKVKCDHKSANYLTELRDILTVKI